MLPFETVQSDSSVDYVIIWMHGLGADGHDFVPLIPELALPKSPGIRFIFPHAPVRPVTLNNGMAMRAWYDINNLDFSNRADLAGLQQSAGQVIELIEAQIALGIDCKQIFLAGFSQGGALALYTALRYAKKLAGVIALSTYLPAADSLAAELASTNQQIPIFYAHGQSDNVINIDYARESLRLLQSLNYEIEWHEYAMEHQVCAKEISDLSLWLQKYCTTL